MDCEARDVKYDRLLKSRKTTGAGEIRRARVNIL